MAGTRKLRVLRHCKYGRNSVTMKCYKKVQKSSKMDTITAMGKKGENVEKAVKPKTKTTAKAKRTCKYGRNLATDKCYTKAERAKIDKKK